MSCECGCNCNRMHKVIFILLACLLFINAMDCIGTHRMKYDMVETKSRLDCLEAK